ncbi:hypothetical protein BDK61_4314 [Haloarcula quadrata]|jgi:hypothetical protein|uniref:Uncharacterized protein n=2 Tax=Haloarcula TaxID=2237 RepID=A0A495QQM6_9EURY|nr:MULTISPECIES: hypothetical protein [Haloarcula]EMA13882.1 hypothetical protein C435_16395 [Haloarcula californiae ATCC 33799]RKS75797.1 hypothetical protein BDK61_4314 [Haloarcula quadrata]
MSVQIDGFGDLADQLDSLAGDIESLDGENEIPINELFRPQFMQTHTEEFESFEGFIDASPWTVETEADFEAIPEDEFDAYVAEHTVFKDWESMLSAAGKEWVVRQISI